MVDESRLVTPDDDVHRHVEDLFASDGLLPRHGPYGPGRTAAAAALLVEVARYLNYATQYPEGLAWPSTAGRIVAGLADTIVTIDQALGQTSRLLTAMADDPRAYIDRVGTAGVDELAPTGAALAFRAYVAQATGSLADAALELRQAARHAGRIGLRDPQPGDDGEGDHGGDDRG